MSESNQWFIVKQDNGQCALVSDGADDKPEDSSAQSELETPEQWGPFASQAEAIARRVGLIRAGKCQPA